MTSTFLFVWDPMACGDSRLFDDTVAGFKKARRHAKTILNEIAPVHVARVRIEERIDLYHGEVLWSSDPHEELVVEEEDSD
jgi:hypothetical protein